MPRVLLIDRSAYPSRLALIKRKFTEAEIIVSRSLDEALALMDHGPFDIVLIVGDLLVGQESRA